MHPPKKPQLSPHKHIDISYGYSVQYAVEADSSPPLDSLGIKRVQDIINSLLYYARAVNNKLIVTLSAIGDKQAPATEHTSASITKLIEYIVMYPNYGIAYHTSSMFISGYSDTSFPNEIKARSRAGSHIFISEDVSIPSNNVSLLTISQITKSAMSSADKS